jgi:Transglycosylase SLT domain/Peptidase family M23
MNRKLLTALASAGAISIGVGATAAPASAEMRTFVVTLLGGSKVTVTVDAPASLPASQVALPKMQLPVIGVVEITPTAVPTPTVTVPPVTSSATPTPTRSPTATPTPSATHTPGSGSSSGQTPSGAHGGSQQAQKTRHHKLGAGQPGLSGAVTGAVDTGKKAGKNARHRAKSALPDRTPGGQPTIANPTYSVAQPGAAPIGVPNFFIDQFRIPPFLLPIYQAAGIQYGVRWEVLAAINEIETDYGRNLNVSTAGAVGWMQFMPSTWKRYGVDANHDGIKDPYNPVDAIFAAARYLRAAGADTNLRRAIFSYNHATWYVDSVLLRARLLGGLPSNLVGSLTGLTEGMFPVAARATYADDITDAQLAKARKRHSPTWLVQSNAQRRGIHIFAKPRSPVVAVNDGRIVHVGRSHRLGRFVQLQDVYGNTYTYGHLKSTVRLYPAPKKERVSQRQIARELKLPKADPRPTGPATAGKKPERLISNPATRALTTPAPALPKPSGRRVAAHPQRTAPAVAKSLKERLFANPFRPQATRHGGDQQILAGQVPRGSFEVAHAGLQRVFGPNVKRKDLTLKRLKPGARVIAGTMLGRIGHTQPGVAPHVLFEIRPAGRGAPRIDPKPILDGWKLLESTAIYRAAGKNPFFGSGTDAPSIGQILLMSKEGLQRMVLADPRVQIYPCGRRDIQFGQIDRRVLATLEFLSLSGLKPTVSALKCGHSFLTTSGNVSEHSSGNAVDIAAVNGIPIAGHQGPGSITDITIRRLLTLQGLMKPHQIISLMTYPGADNTLSLPDHWNHIHVGFRPLYGTNKQAAKQVNAVLRPHQWIKLIGRLGQIDNPTVRLKPSKFAIPDNPKLRTSRTGD